MPEKCLIFLHIPKCAGQTIHYIIRRQYPRPTILHTPGGAEGVQFLRDQTPQSLEKIHLIQGHLPYDAHTLIDSPATYFTMVRHPVDRIVSHYYYVFRTREHYLHETVSKNKMTLLDYATSNLTPELDNGQSRLLYGIDGESLETFGAEEGAQVLSNLENIAAIGITECFDESVLLYQQVLGWKTPVYRSTNVNRKRANSSYAVDDKTREVIAERNKYDMQMYEKALEVFQKQIATHVPDMDRRLSLFPVQQRLHQWRQNPLINRTFGKVHSLINRK